MAIHTYTYTSRHRNTHTHAREVDMDPTTPGKRSGDTLTIERPHSLVVRWLNPYHHFAMAVLIPLGG